ncbi:two-component response regulator, putative [Babesia ovata]|uniref:Two-component response regulator, putative n=1 Tax=Babesia ovata TaxID=189622 RepID=A0A2H6KBW0_9APIC|nr:two-component response regulator, putative [Babesia ovata]GBE60483.1 two-component response regulator, putative [Babesia ovata]
MRTFGSDGPVCESDANDTQNRKGTSSICRPSVLRHRSIKALVLAKLIHLSKRLLLENTPWSHGESLKIAIILLRSIPPRGYLAEDLFLLFVRLLQRENSVQGVDSHSETVTKEKFFLKFLSIAGSTTPYLRPLALLHGARMLAKNARIYEMICQIQRNCTEWNLEKHHAAQFYKWIVKHTDAICNSGADFTSDYRIDLEHILITCAELRTLPNASIFRLFIEAHKNQPEKISRVLDTFISLFPRVDFLRKYRAYHLADQNNTEDVIKYVYASGFGESSIALAMERKQALTLKERLLMLFEITIAEPNIMTNWERLTYHLLTEAPLDDVLRVIDDLFANELNRAKSLFTKKGTWAFFIKGKLVKYYLAVAKIVLFKEPNLYSDLYEEVKSRCTLFQFGYCVVDSRRCCTRL